MNFIAETNTCARDWASVPALALGVQPNGAVEVINVFEF